MSRYWIGVDLDGTLAEYSNWEGEFVIGAPIPKMVERVKKWVAAGKTVKVMTARAAQSKDGDRDVPKIIAHVKTWCEEHIGTVLEVTASKDYAMIELWDDRAIQLIPNTGERVDGKD